MNPFFLLVFPGGGGGGGGWGGARNGINMGKEEGGFLF